MLEARTVVMDESGQGMVEYGLIIGLISVVAIAGLIALRSVVLKIFEDTNTKFNITTT